MQISRQWWMNDLYVEKIYSHFRFPAMLRHAIIIIITRWILKRLRRLQQNSFLLAALKIPSLNDILQRQNELHSSKSLLKNLKNRIIEKNKITYANVWQLFIDYLLIDVNKSETSRIIRLLKTSTTKYVSKSFSKNKQNLVIQTY